MTTFVKRSPARGNVLLKTQLSEDRVNYTAIAERDVFLRALDSPKFRRNSKLGIFTKGNKGNKEWVWLRLRRARSCASANGRRRRDFGYGWVEL